MAGRELESFLRRLRRVLSSQGAEGVSDSQLLARFVQHRDEEAFELLVWRHGLMVLNVCRRMVHHEQDAEDAFQATFLALARKAEAIGKRESVGSWLYKFAYRIALRAKSADSSRLLTQVPLPEPSSRVPLNELLDREFSTAIDEEIQRLPEKYRAALVLCHLEGQTIESAARSLACPPATRRHLVRARPGFTAPPPSSEGVRCLGCGRGAEHHRDTFGGAGKFDCGGRHAWHDGESSRCGNHFRLCGRLDERSIPSHVLDPMVHYLRDPYHPEPSRRRRGFSRSSRSGR
jgi:RNA polymerase sigma factor (sigma-70 family)